MKNIIVLMALFVLVSNAEAGPNQGFVLPSERGEVVFSCNQKSPNQIYIIGMGHRDTLTHANGNDTVKSQMEVYRIAEWLIQNQGLELLLPEGFISNEAVDEKESSRSASLDDKSLAEKLGADDVYINAEMLLMESYRLDSQQVEDEELYRGAREKISQLEKYDRNSFEVLFLKSELNYLQQRRTAAMLQMIPEVIASEFGAGRIMNKKAIFTIGMSHVSEIIRYLQQQRIEIISPAFTPYDDYSSGVELLEKDFGVTIIVPRTLVDNHELLKLTRLDNLQRE